MARCMRVQVFGSSLTVPNKVNYGDVGPNYVSDLPRASIPSLKPDNSFLSTKFCGRSVVSSLWGLTFSGSIHYMVELPPCELILFGYLGVFLQQYYTAISIPSGASYVGP